MEYQEKLDIIEEYKELYSEPLERLEKGVKKIFPNAKISAQVYNGIGSPTLGITFYLISDRDDQTNKIVDNDPAVTKFIAHLPMEHPTKDTKFKLEKLMGGLYIEPEEKYLAMSRVKLPYRKSTGNIDKQVDKVIKYFKGVGQTILDNKDKLYKKDIKDKYLDIRV